MPEIDEVFIRNHIIHLFKAGWRGMYKATDRDEKLIACVSAKSMQQLAKNMELDINFDEIEMEIDLDHLQSDL